MNLSSNEVGLTQLGKIPKWYLVDESWIERRFKFRNFTTAMKFVNLIASDAEENKHHPFISIHYNIVILQLTSLEKDTLTFLDIEMAKRFDVLYKEMK